MAVTINHVDTNSLATGDTLSTTGSVDPAANELWCVFLVMRSTSITPSISGTGLSWTEIANVTNTQSQMKAWLWRGLSTSDPAAGTITVTMTGNTLPAVLVVWKAVGCDTSGTNGSGAIDASATNAGPAVDDNDMLCAITTGVANAVVVGNGSHRTGTFTVPVGENAVSINNTGGSGGTLVSASVWQKDVPTAGATQIGDVNDLSGTRDWLVIAVSLKPGAVTSKARPPQRKTTRIWTFNR